MNETVSGRVADAERAKEAMREFIGPSFSVVRADYVEKLAEIAAKPLTDQMRAGMEKLALAIKVLDQVKIQITELIADGTLADQARERTDKMMAVSAEQRRWGWM